ncbi:MAG: FtsH protease activity modulator HflK, partial [Alphaproteobacteria bacterium]
MSWTTPGGGGPWGRGPGAPQPPNLEEFLRQGQDRFRRMMPGGLSSGRGLLLIVLAAVILWAMTGLYRVQPEQEGVVLRFGEFVYSTDPGLHYRLPWPIESVEKPNVTAINSIDIGFVEMGATAGTRGGKRDIAEESLMLTGDQNIIDIDFTVLWKIKDAGQFLFNIRDPQATVKIAAESAMREVIGRTDIQPALTEARREIEVDTLALLQRILDDYGAGILITQVQLQDVRPPGPVVDAFDDVQRALQDRDRLRNEADAYRNDLLPRARGDSQVLIQEARAYKEEVVNRS